MSEPVDLPEHGESGLVFVLIFEILKLDLVAQCRATHEGKLKLQSHLFSDFSEERKQMPPRLGFAFVRCPATGYIERLAKCYNRDSIY